MITTDQLEDFISDNIRGNDIWQAEEELKCVFDKVECYDEDIDDGTDEEGVYLMYKAFNCYTEEEYYDVILYYCNDDDIVTDYRIR